MPHLHPLWWDPASGWEAMCLLQLPSWKAALWPVCVTWKRGRTSEDT